MDNKWLVDAFKILSNPLRFRLVLALRDEGPATHSELCERLQKPLGLWPHLQAMARAGLIIRTTDDDDRYVTYALNFKSFADLGNNLLVLASKEVK